MREMKASGVEWIEEIPADWEIQRLKAHFGFGKGLPITKANLQEEGVPVVSYGQIHAKTTDGVHLTPDMFRYVNPEFLETNPSSLVGPGSFIVADTSEDLDGVGNAILVQESDAFPLFAGYHTIILKASENRDNRYLAYLFQTDAWRSQIRADLIEVKLYSVAQKVLKEAHILIPPESEQHAIADYLDEKCAAIDEARSDTEREITLLKEYRQALITRVVTKGLDPDAEMKDSGVEWIGEIPAEWQTRKIKFLLEKGRSSLVVGPFGSSLTSNMMDDKGIPIYNQKFVLDGGTWNAFLKPEYYEQLASFTVHPGDILITTRGTIGKVRIVNQEEYQLGILHPCLIRFRINQDLILANFAKHVFNGTRIAFEQVSYNSQGTTIDVIYSNTLRELSIPLPPIEKQKELVDYLDTQCAAIDDQIADLEAELAQLDDYKKSLIYYCVTGKKEVPADAC